MVSLSSSKAVLSLLAGVDFSQPYHFQKKLFQKYKNIGNTLSNYLFVNLLIIMFTVDLIDSSDFIFSSILSMPLWTVA